MCSLSPDRSLDNVMWLNLSEFAKKHAEVILSSSEKMKVLIMDIRCVLFLIRVLML